MDTTSHVAALRAIARGDLSLDQARAIAEGALRADSTPEATTTTDQPSLVRIRITYEVLAYPDRPDIVAQNPNDLIYSCVYGDLSGREISRSVVELSHVDALAACREHDTDPAWFSLPAFLRGSKVHWTDPDGDSCSQDATIVKINGDIYSLLGESGGEIEALEHELSEVAL